MRFGFGKNWKSYSKVLTPERIAIARGDIARSLGIGDFSGLRVLDIGSGSGLSSLAFLQMGADVTAFDYDGDSVECTESILKSEAPSGSEWRVMQGSVLDREFMASLGKFDVVYSWGVLHHTGAIWNAMDLAADAVADNGVLLIALYNDQGMVSALWKCVKWIYCSSRAGRILVKAYFYPLFFAYSLLHDLKNMCSPGTHMRTYSRNRGMSILHDWDDWLGGYPFDVASHAEVASWAGLKKLSLRVTRNTRGLGCNEFVLRKDVKS